jgi:hypothetical protein
VIQEGNMVAAMVAVPVGEELGQFVTVRFEACDGFVADGSGTDVCADCGWLHDEHATAARRAGDVRVLRPRRRPAGSPQRKAS